MRVAPQFGLRHGPSLAKSRYVSIIVGGDYWKQLAGDVLHCCTALPCFALGAASLQALQQSRFGCVLIEHGPPSEPAVHYLRQIENAFATIVDGG